MLIKAKYSRLTFKDYSNHSISSILSDDDGEDERDNLIAQSMYRHPRYWILAVLLTGTILICIFVISMRHLGNSLNEQKSWLQRYHAKEYSRSIPKDNPLDAFKVPVNAVLVVLCRNSELSAMIQTIQNFEERFNKKYQYPYVFLNNEAFDQEFKEEVAANTNAKIQFGIVPDEHWSYPSWIDKQKAAMTRREMGERGVIYGGSESYRFMCRYFSGFMHKHPLLQQFDYYWRIEPGVRFPCDINYDVFRFMKNNAKEYGFTIAMQEIAATVPTLWETVLNNYLPKSPRSPEPTAIRYFGSPTPRGYNGCHFWSNFEIASFRMFRSVEYQRYFDTLDRAGGFFYERWGDAPVHSIAVGLFLTPKQVHHFHDIGYYHAPFGQCPTDFQVRRDLRCDCDPFDPNDVAHGTCQTLWHLHYDGL